MKSRVRPSGQPIAVLGLVLSGWTLLRLAMLEGAGICPGSLCRDDSMTAPAAAAPPPDVPPGPEILGPQPIDARPTRRLGRRTRSGADVLTWTSDPPQAWDPGVSPARPEPAIGSQAGRSARADDAAIPTAGADLPATGRPLPAARELSGDAWVLVRGRGSGVSALAPSYGASQAGLVLRCPFGGRPLAPFAYLRTSAALGVAERDLGLGLGARPLARLPLILAGEMRVVQAGEGHRVRPAVGMITAAPPRRLAARLAATLYAQAGWVGGRESSAYAEGQIVVDRAVTFAGGATLRAGVGSWGATQRGAARLDAGPTVSVTVPISDHAALRVEADWRQRLAGNAKPGSGPALVVATSF